MIMSREKFPQTPEFEDVEILFKCTSCLHICSSLDVWLDEDGEAICESCYKKEYGALPGEDSR
jgi:formylmethanofuran dehydrogenase subunit E